LFAVAVQFSCRFFPVHATEPENSSKFRGERKKDWLFVLIGNL
jgi:hypothetical protein